MKSGSAIDIKGTAFCEELKQNLRKAQLRMKEQLIKVEGKLNSEWMISCI